MMRKSLSLILCLVIAASGYAQINFSYLQTDSLRNELAKAKHDTSRVLLMADLSEGFRWSKSDSAMYYGQKALLLAQKINFKRGEASALLSVSVVERELGNLAKALDLATKALSIARGHFSEEEISALIRVANVYSASKDYDKALLFLHQAEDKSKLAGNNLSENISQWLMAAAFEQMNKLDSAWYYADMAFKNMSWAPGAGFAYNIIADIQLKLKKDSLALQNYWIGLAEASKTKDYRTVANLNISLANYYKKHNQADSAIYYAKVGLAVAQLLSYKNRIISSSSILAEIYESKDPKEALKYHKIFNSAKDSLYGPEKMQALQMLMMKEQEKQKEAEAATIAYQNRVKQYALLVGLLFFLIIMVLLYRNNRRKQKSNELLQKQKQEIEERRAEAEIETALEKVRTIAMGMRKREDMLEVCKVISQQLQLLHVKDIRNVQTAIFYESKGTYMNYEYYDKHNKLLTTEVGFKEHPAQYEFAYKMMQGRDEFFTLTLEGQKLKDWYEYQKTTPQFADSYLESATSLNYYWYAMEPAALGLSTYAPITAEQIVLFKRFRNVFALAYQRFADIEQAEAQAREAQIEAALERVRSRSMAMHKSDELLEVINVISEQLQQLNIKFGFVSFGFIEPNLDYDFWLASPGFALPERIHAPYIDNPIPNTVIEAQRKGLSFFTNTFSKKDSDQWLRVLFEYNKASRLFEKTKDILLSSPGFARSAVILKNISIFIGNYIPRSYSNEENEIIKRFANVFEQSYTRFLDLQKAEVQAREAQIEAALEKVRSRSLAMHRSEEIIDVARTLYEKLNELKVENDAVLIIIFHEDPIEVTLWLVRETRQFSRVTMKFTDLPFFKGLSNARKKGEDLFTISFLKKEKNELFKFFFQHPGFKETPKEEQELIFQTEQINFSIALAKNIGIQISNYSEKNFSDRENEILKRFAKVFDQSYTRFLDLKKAEAQAREAQVETALEKLRSRTLAMRKSGELAETAAVLFQQLIALGIEPNRLYINIMKNRDGEAEFWITDEDGSKVSSAFETNLNCNSTFQKMLTGWLEEKRSMIINMEGDELREYFEYLTSINVPFKDGLAQQRRVQHIAYFSKGFIGMAAPDEHPAETLQLLERFAYAFNFTFTRFNDLQISEAHALQAEQDLIEIKAARKKAEETLQELQATQKQLIQSEKMASLGELTAGIAHEIQNPLNFVNNFAEINTELLDELKDEAEKGNVDQVKSIADDLKDNNQKIAFHGKRADSIVKGMLQHSRTSTGKKELTDINALADEFLRLSYHGLRAKDKSFNAAMETNFDYNIDKIHIVPQDLGRVLLNLFNNAFYSVNEKKKALNGLYEPKVFVSTEKIGERVQIIVKDNGGGIPQKVLDKIYHPFFTTKPTGEGTGLGLSLSYDIITKGHGGELKVETKEGEYALFKIILPIENKK